MTNWIQRTLRPFIAMMLLCGMSFASGLTFAADPEEASRLFQEGRTAMKANDYETAVKKLRESQGIDPSSGTLLNLAICEEKLGRLGQAWKHLEEVLQALPDGDPRLPIAQKQAASLERRVPRITLRMDQPQSDGVEVRLDDGSEPVKLGVSLPVDPGVHVVTIGKTQVDRVHRFRIAEGERKEVWLPIPESPKSESSRTTTSTNEAPETRTPTEAYVLLGVGAVGVATGSYLWFRLRDKQRIVDDNCDANKRCNEQGMVAADDGKSMMPFYTGAWIAGAAGLAAGTYFLLKTDGSNHQEPTVDAGPTTGGALVQVRGTF